MGAVTVSIKKRDKWGATNIVWADVTFSGTYAAGGDTFTPGQFEMTTIHAINDCGTPGSATSGYILVPDLANNKLRLMSMGAVASTVTPLAETTTAAQGGTVARVRVEGNNPYI